jgi:hypothetical protein
MSSSILGGELHFTAFDLTAIQPTIEESNSIIKIFFEQVNPFIRILHQGYFAKELEQYRRSVFFLPEEFEALLFSIYVLTISTINAETVNREYGVDKMALLDRFHNAAQVALAKVNFYKTDKILTLQALLHFVVSNVIVLSE